MQRDLQKAATSALIWDWCLAKMIRATTAHSCVSPRLVTHTCDDCWLGAHSSSWGRSDPIPSVRELSRRAAAARPGLPPVHPHVLRDSCGFSLANRGYGPAHALAAAVCGA